MVEFGQMSKSVTNISLRWKQIVQITRLVQYTLFKESVTIIINYYISKD